MTGFSVSVPIVDDNVAEFNETFFVILTTAGISDYIFDVDSATVTILDDDGEYTIFKMDIGGVFECSSVYTHSYMAMNGCRGIQRWKHSRLYLYTLAKSV